ncbi:Transforming growth factor-beta receptor-associated protein 1 [Acipenser ruthenus]|uniref:Transforming growth factor-beta receptor-associated protein 1 n=1 Tax=Acipenser ruthenus TaxID=7906 RepID=A0A662YSI2_ACIRT|nr:Transforming growth factor-beta receptor-associated protein 1 [Acipenser ruthenus]
MSVKAFELVPAVERALLMGDKARINIECIECCGKNLYVGTNDCFIYHFLLEEKTTSKEKLTFSVQKQQHKYLGLKKPVSELKAASALNRLIVLCDNTIMLVNMLNLDPVQSGAKIKGVVTFTVNENPVNGDPFSVELGVISVKRRTIQIYMVYEDRVQIVKELATPEQPSAVCLDGYFLCLALTTQYIIVNYSTGASQDLFPFDTEEKKPIVKRIGREEFLLAGPGGLGMFATAAGISQRAPVHWSENVIGAAICFPYVVALDEGFVTVHSMLDQQLKQTLPFRDGHIMQDFEGKVILATMKEVYVLVPLPLERQLLDLLASQRVEEAIVLVEGAQRNIPKEKFLVMYRRILQQAGFIQFGQLQFLEAKDSFSKGQLDARELISLYPLLLPSTSTFTRSHPPLHEFADLNHLTQGDQEKITKCKRFLINYLKEIRSTEVANGYKEDVDTALLKLYAEADHESLLDLLVSENFCLLVDSAPWLEKHKNLFIVCSDILTGKIKDTNLNLECAILYGKLEEHDKALHILVHQLKDFQAAEDYCLWNSEGRDLSYRQRLFHMLLAVYMDPAVANDTLVMAAVDLLNTNAEVFDAVRVLRLVPGNWSIQLLCPFLRGAMRENMHSKRMSQVALGLAKSENAIYKHEKLKYKGLINLSEKKGCQLCHNTFSEPECVCYPNGILVHIHCAAKRNRDSASKQHFTNPSNHT